MRHLCNVRAPFDQSVEEFIDSVTTIERLGSYWSVAEGEMYQALVADAAASVKAGLVARLP